MPEHLETQDKKTDLCELHITLHFLEQSYREMGKTVKPGKASSNYSLHLMINAFLKSTWKYWFQSAKSFKTSLRHLDKWSHIHDHCIRYLTGRGYCLNARHLLREGNLEKAEQYVNQAGSIADVIGFPYLKAETLEILSRIKSSACIWSTAHAIIEKALNLYTAQRWRDLRGEARAWEARGKIFFEEGRFAQSHQDLENSINLWRQCLDEIGFAETQLLRAHLCYHIRDDARCRKLLEEIESLCINLDYTRGQGTIKRYQGKLLLRENRWEEALELFHESLNLFNRVGDPAGLARAHLSLARTCAGGRKIDEALNHYSRAESIFNEIEDSIREATAMVTKGLVLARTGSEKKEAIITLFDQALELYRKQGDRRHIATAQFDIGKQYHRWEDYDSAALCVEESIRIASEMHAERLVERYHKETLTIKADKYYQMMLQSRKQREAMYSMLNFAIHDINNEVSKLILPLEQMNREDCSAEDRRKFQARAQLTVKYIGPICQGMLDIAKAGDGELPVSPVELSLRAIVDKVFLLMERRFTDNSIQAENEVSDTTTVWADQQHLERILVNLIGNAVKFSGKGAIVVQAVKRESRWCICRQCTRVTVADTGFGIPREMRERVFNLFDQAEGTRELERQSTTLVAERGYGIGLAYCQKAVNSHKGAIWIDPVLTCRRGEDDNAPERHGTVIHFTLPGKETVKY